MEKEKILVKVGGSLIENSEKFDYLVHFLEKTSLKVDLILTTGSKELSDIIREYIGTILKTPVSIDTHVDITMQSRDMMARSFAGSSNKFVAVDSMEAINASLKENKVPIIVQYPLLKSLSPFPLKRGLSTDTTSAFFAKHLKANRFVKLTNVDGVFNNYGIDINPLNEIGTQELKQKGKTCIDVTLAEYLEKIKMCCFVMNGHKTDNVDNFIDKRPSNFTCVYPTK